FRVFTLGAGSVLVSASPAAFRLVFGFASVADFVFALVVAMVSLTSSWLGSPDPYAASSPAPPVAPRQVLLPCLQPLPRWPPRLRATPPRRKAPLRRRPSPLPWSGRWPSLSCPSPWLRALRLRASRLRAPRRPAPLWRPLPSSPFPWPRRAPSSP